MSATDIDDLQIENIANAGHRNAQGGIYATRVIEFARAVIAADRAQWSPADTPLGLVLGEVAAERARQDEKWGGPRHDDLHLTPDFVQLIQDYAAWARVMHGMANEDKARRRLLQVAALAVAAVETIDRRANESIREL